VEWNEPSSPRWLPPITTSHLPIVTLQWLARGVGIGANARHGPIVPFACATRPSIVEALSSLPLSVLVPPPEQPTTNSAPETIAPNFMTHSV